jgi:NAD(P)-dependent dehydrogenase (short-subunit alcohol dehydrogenase family)
MTAMRPIRFDGQVAVVTGAGRGLGAAYAHLLAARGAAVVVHDAGVAEDGSGFDPEVAQQVAREIEERGGTAVACYDNLETAVGCRNVIEFAIERLGRIDVLIHNAGLVVFAAVEAIDEAKWARMMNLGVSSSFHLVQAVIPSMRRQRYGRIVLTTSGRAMRIDDAAPGLVGYSIGKMAQLGLMVGLAAEMESADLRINAVAPVAATRVLRRRAPELLPELVAPGVVFLASSQCDFSGVTLRAAGGRFSTAHWRLSAEIDFGRTPTAPEEIAARWPEILGTEVRQ